ncbi:hypothetical protein SAMN05421676_10228 [Salinibacillus kushneri]|uniref:Uncharacterized protein n=1 Tax=Salinibacillus kushneri TaxID=237682 RepID=A0A1I0A474_9BACI|nr:hypothetical protein [Salinibacillus kushneri]SES88871.1 hypothetical protein SAMN05421676_10228 [Salinibacillus kushneri]
MDNKGYFGKTKENEIVEFNNGDYMLMIARFRRINWSASKKDAQYQYFFYAIDKRLNTWERDTLDTIVREIAFESYEVLTDNLFPILSEYILINEAIYECLKLVEKLNPIYLNKE